MIIYKDLYAFFVTAQCKTINNAAKQLNTNSASIGVHIKRLEEKYGHQLVIRKSVGLELTKEGHDLFNKISKHYTELGHVISQEFHKGVQAPFLEEIKVLSTTGIVGFLLSRAIQEFHHDFPEIRIKVTTHEGPYDFGGGNYDVGVLPTFIDNPQAITKIELTTLKVTMLCSKEYLKEYGTPKSLDDLKDHKFIGYYTSASGPRGNIDWHLKYSRTGEANIQYGHLTGLIELAHAGLGIIAGTPGVAPNLEGLRTLFPEVYSKVDLFAIKSRYKQSQNIDNFIKYIKKYYQSLPTHSS